MLSVCVACKDSISSGDYSVSLGRQIACPTPENLRGLRIFDASAIAQNSLRAAKIWSRCNTPTSSRGATNCCERNIEPYWLAGSKGTTHGTPYNYDTHVPVIFMGAGIKAGRFSRHTAPNDIAPTLATMLGVEIPSGSSGRVLDEILVTQ